MKNSIYRLKYLFLGIFISLNSVFTVEASTFMPLVSNFTSRQYHASIQNWCCTQDDDGIMYFANNDGLLTFDGTFWKHFSVPGNYIIRSVLIVEDRIYVGSFEEFGYFSKEESGNLCYTSISQNLKNFKFNNDEIWNIVKCGDYIYFQSFQSWFRLDKNDQISGYSDTTKAPLYFFEYDKNIYTQIIDGNFCRLNPTMNSFTTVFPRSAINNDNIVAMHKSLDDKILLFSEHNGIFTLNNGLPQKITTEIDSKFPDVIINRATITKDGIIIIGTIQDGIFALDRNYKLLWHYNSDNGLNNNSVLGVFCDNDNNIWAALDDGIALIHNNAPYSILTPDIKDPQIGMVYSVLQHEDDIYMATNQGVYIYSAQSKNIRQMPNLNSQNWHITKIDNQIFIGNNHKTVIISENSRTDLPHNSTCIKKGKIHQQEVLIEASYYEISVYLKDTKNNWKYSHSVDGFGSPIRQLEIDDSGIIWASHMSSGFFKIELTPDLKKVKSFSKYKTLNPNIKNSPIFVMKIRGKIVFSDTDKLYIYDDITRSFKSYDQFNNALPSLTNIYGCTMVDNNNFWISSKQQYNLINYTDGQFKKLVTIPLEQFNRESNGVNNDVFVIGNTAYFNFNNSIGRYTGIDEKPLKNHIPTLSINSVNALSQNGTNIQLPIASDSNGNIEIAGNITFRISFPNYNNLPYKFRYELTGGDSPLISTSDTPEISYGDLPFGDYTFKASVIDDAGESINTITYKFSVPQPFFYSAFAIIIYILISSGIIYLITKWLAKRELQKKQKIYEQEQAEQNIKILEQQKIITEQEKQLLEAELATKTKELANLALDAYSKQRVIESLRETMQEHRRKGKIDTREVDTLIRRIDSDAGDKEFWAIFQNNFDLIHEHFFRNLRKEYPQLTSSDLKFCALLRLNMSTKDIAKFTNMSVRGVETARYRLRKRMNIPTETSIVKFLIDFTPSQPVNPNSTNESKDQTKAEDLKLP